VHNEIIIGLLVKNNTRRLYSVRDSFLMRILIGLNIPYSSICTFLKHEYYKEFTNFPYKHIFKTKGSKKFSFTPEDSAPSSRWIERGVSARTSLNVVEKIKTGTPILQPIA